MTDRKAIEYLLALGCCSSEGLFCEECPLYDEEKVGCKNWNDTDIVKAVHAIQEREERSKGCVWCNQNGELFEQIYELNAEKPKFCPWCGRPLKGAEE